MTPSSSRPAPRASRQGVRALALVAALVAGPAAAHVGTDVDTAVAGRWQSVGFRIGHGCDGSPTTSVTVFVPRGVAVAKPRPKPGWTLEVRRAPLPSPVRVHGREVAEAASELTWSGGRLDDAHFDEFAVLMLMPSTPGSLDVRVLQRCERGEHDWAEPAEAKGRSPAPRITVVPAGSQGGGHRH